MGFPRAYDCGAMQAALRNSRHAIRNPRLTSAATIEFPILMDSTDIVPCCRPEVLRTLQAAHGDPERCQDGALLFPDERDRSKWMSDNTMLKAIERPHDRARISGCGFYRPERDGVPAGVIAAQLAHVEENRVRATTPATAKSDASEMQPWADFADAVAM
jgi:hypothetical protein